ncbi:trans-sialidase [Trypanosoma cruzi]|nr:trans-sialidase [Trypanosoma cruzi]
MLLCAVPSGLSCVPLSAWVLWSPRTCLMYCRCCCPLHLLKAHARKVRHQVRIATVRFEGSEGPTAHTHICTLSRAAAVKAPRTHNRRRVTGSSGRRRNEESGKQRPNMSRRVFNSAVLLLLVVMMCCATCGAAAAVENSDSVADPNFAWRGVTDDKETVDSLGVPSILKVGTDVFAVA